MDDKVHTLNLKVEQMAQTVALARAVSEWHLRSHGSTTSSALLELGPEVLSKHSCLHVYKEVLLLGAQQTHEQHHQTAQESLRQMW